MAFGGVIFLDFGGCREKSKDSVHEQRYYAVHSQVIGIEGIL